MAPSRAVQRSKTAFRREETPEHSEEELEVSSPSVLDTAEGGDVNDDSEEDEEEEGSEGSGEEEDASEDEGEEVKNRISTVSFGALAKVLELDGGDTSRKRKRGEEKSEEAEAKLEALRQRLRELRKAKEAKEGRSSKHAEKSSSKSIKDTAESGGRRQDDASEGESSGSDDDSSSPEEENTAKKGRSSKHAPTEQTSKKAVTRRRTVVPLAKSKVRDPRFDPLTGPLNTDDIRRKYAFLDTYQADEISQLRASIKNPKVPEQEKEALRRQLLSMESKRKAREKEDLEQKVLREHRKKERSMIEQGKRPFYLKKSEQKKQALVERFGGMKERERNKVIERRRKKLTAKERKGLPDARRA